MTNLNEDVTAAILKAEEATKEAIKCWEEVWRCELALAVSLPKESLESYVAERGVASALANLDHLRRVLNPMLT